MADKPTLYIDYARGTIQGASEVIGRLFATPKDKSWFGPPQSTIVMSDPQRLRRTVERLRQLGYVLIETPTDDAPASS